MPSDYQRPEWKAFRTELLELDGHRCCRCGGSASSGEILQVHHKLYVRGKRPWEYAYSDCELLCKGCHGAEHGLVRPKVGWDCYGEDDLGDLCGNCEVCDTDLRYVFFISHPHWEPLAVGTDCCDRMTTSEYASAKRRLEDRISRFLKSSRWKWDAGIPEIRQRGLAVRIVEDNQKFYVMMNGARGKAPHESRQAAMRAAFTVIDSGKAQKYFDKRKGDSSSP